MHKLVSIFKIHLPLTWLNIYWSQWLFFPLTVTQIILMIFLYECKRFLTKVLSTQGRDFPFDNILIAIFFTNVRGQHGQTLKQYGTLNCCQSTSNVIVTIEILVCDFTMSVLEVETCSDHKTCWTESISTWVHDSVESVVCAQEMSLVFISRMTATESKAEPSVEQTGSTLGVWSHTMVMIYQVGVFFFFL